MSRNVVFAPGEYYHIYNRGTERRLIFNSSKDRDRFLSLLYLCNSDKTLHVSDHPTASLSQLLEISRGEPLVEICSYCLMPNHFHLIVRQRAERGIAIFMQKLTTAYTMYFNTLNERSGALFQGTYKAQHANNDRYLKYLISYIHLNPVKLIEPQWKETGIKNRKKAEQYLDRYRYSSFLDYCGYERTQKRILAMDALPRYFESPDTFKKSVTDWLTYNVKV